MTQDSLFVEIEVNAAELVVGGASFFSTAAAAATSQFVLPSGGVSYYPGGQPALATFSLGSSKLESVFGGLTIGIA